MTEEKDTEKRQYIITDDVVKMIAFKKKFAEKDVKEILDGLVEVIEECAMEGIVVKMRSFGKLDYTRIPPRSVKAYTEKNGKYHPAKELPETIMVNFRLAQNIRRLGYESLEIENAYKTDEEDE